MPATNKRFIAYGRDRHLRERHDTRTSPGRRAAPKQRNPSHRNRGTPRAQPGDGARNGCADPGVRGTRQPTGVGRAVRRHPLHARRGERRRTRRTRLRGERSGNLRGAPRLIRSRDEHTSSAPCHAVPTAASSPRHPTNPYSGLRRSAREAPPDFRDPKGRIAAPPRRPLSRRAIRSRATSAATARRFRSSPPFHRPPAVAGRLTAPSVVTYKPLPLPVPRSATALRKRPRTDVRSAWSSASSESDLNRPAFKFLQELVER